MVDRQVSENKKQRKKKKREQREERDSVVVMAYEWHSGFFVFEICFGAVTEYVIVSEKKENRARKRRESRAEERERE
jgi:hypothetical protein